MVIQQEFEWQHVCCSGNIQSLLYGIFKSINQVKSY